MWGKEPFFPSFSFGFLFFNTAVTECQLSRNDTVFLLFLFCFLFFLYFSLLKDTTSPRIRFLGWAGGGVFMVFSFCFFGFALLGWWWRKAGNDSMKKRNLERKIKGKGQKKSGLHVPCSGRKAEHFLH